MCNIFIGNYKTLQSLQTEKDSVHADDIIKAVGMSAKSVFLL